MSSQSSLSEMELTLVKGGAGENNMELVAGVKGQIAVQAMVISYFLQIRMSRPITSSEARGSRVFVNLKLERSEQPNV